MTPQDGGKDDNDGNIIKQNNLLLKNMLKFTILKHQVATSLIVTDKNKPYNTKHCPHTGFLKPFQRI